MKTIYAIALLWMLWSLPTDAGAKGILVSDLRNVAGDEYLNPIIHADYSDPDVVASPDGSAFYMTASSFQCAPGLPILRSSDLVNWQLVNYALPKVEPDCFYGAAPRHGKGVWAPCIRYHNGEYFIYWGDPDFGVYMIKSTNPENEWSEPVLVHAAKGMIDPSPFWDENGKAYLSNAWAASRAGFNSIITISEMSADGTRLVSNPRIVFDGNDGINHTVEGTKLYKRGDYYYILAPAGGVKFGWQLAMRSKNIYGPYESKIVMAQGESDINGPHQGGWVTTKDGEDWFINFQDMDEYGRVAHLNPVTWKDNWPVIGIDKDGDGCGEPVARYKKPNLPAQPLVHEADSSLLYQWHANYNDHYGFPIPNGLMRIYGYRMSPDFVNLWEAPNMWLQKFPSRSFMLTTNVRITTKASAKGAESGVIVMGRKYARLGVSNSGEGLVVAFTECDDAENGKYERKNTLCEITPSREYGADGTATYEIKMSFRVRVDRNGMATFYYSLNGKDFVEAGKFHSTQGRWIGAKIGFFSVIPAECHERGWIDVLTSRLDILE